MAVLITKWIAANARCKNGVPSPPFLEEEYVINCRRAFGLSHKNMSITAAELRRNRTGLPP